MTQLSFHTQNNNPLSPPPQRNVGTEELPILIKLGDGYKQWHNYLVNLPRHTRFTVGVKIDNLFTDCLELSLTAGYAPRDKKEETIRRLSIKFDALKFFLKLLWEIKALDTKKYTILSQQLTPVGKMIGGWMNIFKNKPPYDNEGN